MCTRVYEVATRLGYRATTAAHAMRTRRTDIVGLLQDGNLDAELRPQLEQALCGELDAGNQFLVINR